MKFTINSRKLSTALQKIGKVIANKNSLPILDCFLFIAENNQLKIIGSDNENRLSATITEVDIEEEGRLCIPAKILLESLSVLSDQPITFDINTNNYEVFIYYHNGKYNLMGDDDIHYPQPKTLDELAKKSITISSKLLQDAINNTAFAQGDDELRPTMNGVYFDFTPNSLFLVASDGHKLVKTELDGIKLNETASFIFPAKGISLLKTLFDKEDVLFTLTFDLNRVTIQANNYTLSCRFIEGRYPNYNSVIPQKNPYNFEIDSKVLMGIIKRVSAFGNKENCLVKLDLTANNLTVSAQNLDFSTAAEEKVEVSYEGQPMAVGFKSTFLIETLSALTDGEVKIELNDPSKAALIIPCMSKYGINSLGLLMPMMLND